MLPAIDGVDASVRFSFESGAKDGKENLGKSNCELKYIRNYKMQNCRPLSFKNARRSICQKQGLC